jgi:hypothetical protein
VGVTTGANDKAALLAAGADLIVADLSAFVVWLSDSAPRPGDVTSGP